jgi:hypothetical protein
VFIINRGNKGKESISIAKYSTSCLIFKGSYYVKTLQATYKLLLIEQIEELASIPLVESDFLATSCFVAFM